MLKVPMIAGIAGLFAVTAIAIDTSPVLAQQGQVCLNPYAGVVPLSHDPMVPNEGFGYDKSFVDQQLSRGNRCPNTAGTSQQSTPFIPYNQRVPQAQRNKTGRSYY